MSIIQLMTEKSELHEFNLVLLKKIMAISRKSRKRFKTVISGKFKHVINK